ncbi:hypothetical protein GCM10010191_85720 [Actinomadura vinacea]|uniref:NifU family protein n=1 Tax=Actinomadura vinacea TaxID=115336 RepID=A0ABP5XEI8_9ACTN
MADRRLDAAAVADRLGRLDEALARLERTPGATAETALDAVVMLTEVYGEALARVLDRVSGDRGLVDAMLGDDLVGHLLVLHDVHPEPAERRIVRALEALGAGAEFEAVEGRTARIRLTAAAGGGGCGSGCGGGGGAEPVEEAVRDAVLAVAPELTGVDLVRPDAAKAGAAFIPVGALLNRAGPAADGAPDPSPSGARA